MQRDDLQRRILHFLIGPTHEIAQDNNVVSKVARIKGRIQNTAVGKSTIENDCTDLEVAQEKIEVGRIKRRQPFLGVDSHIFRCNMSYKLCPARSLDSMLVGVRNLTCVERKN